LAGCQGIVAVNEPSPRVQPKDEVCLHSHGNQSITNIFTNRGARYPIRSSST